MMFYKFLFFISFTVVLTSCQKKDTTPYVEPVKQVYPSYFYWSDNTMSGFAYKADSAFWKYENGYTSIKAYKGGIVKNLKINFDGNLNYVDAYTVSFLLSNPANFTVTSNPILGFKYTDGVNTYSSTSTNILHISDSKTVTTNVNNIITGQFNAVSVSGSGPISVISGTFSNLPNKN